MPQADDETIPGERIVQLIESTPLDDASDVQVDNDFLPVLKEVMGQVPNVILQVRRGGGCTQEI